jgi:hypothetical protein
VCVEREIGVALTFINSHFNLPFLPYARSKICPNALSFPPLAASNFRKSCKTRDVRKRNEFVIILGNVEPFGCV